MMRGIRESLARQAAASPLVNNATTLWGQWWWNARPALYQLR